MQRNVPLLIFSVLAILLAGCHEPEGGNGDGTPTPTTTTSPTPTGTEEPTSVSLEAQDPPTAVDSNQTYNITVVGDSNREVSTDHAGFHYGYNTTIGMDADEYQTVLTKASPHTSATYPGNYTISWTIDAEDEGRTIYYRAHTIVDGQAFWGDEHQMVVSPVA